MKIVLSTLAYNKFMFGVLNCNKEIGYMGRVTFDKKNCIYTVTNVYLPTQEITGASTDLDADSVAKCEIDSINEKGYFNAWLHSHVNMGVFWSPTDTETIKGMGQKGLCIAIVGNKKKEMRGAVYVHSEEDHVPDIFNDNVPVSVEESIVDNAIWLTEINDKLRIPAPIVYPAHNPNKRSTILTEGNKHKEYKKDYSSMFLDDFDGYGTYGNNLFHEDFIEDSTNEIAPTGISNAYKKEVKHKTEKALKEKIDFNIFTEGKTHFTMLALSELSRTEVQTIINSSNWKEYKKIELMSKWFYIPSTFPLHFK